MIFRHIIASPILAILILGTLILATPLGLAAGRTAFAEALAKPGISYCFDGAAAVKWLGDAGYRIRGLGFTDGGGAVIELWVHDNGAFQVTRFDGATGTLCIIGAGAGWQNYPAGAVAGQAAGQ